VLAACKPVRSPTPAGAALLACGSSLRRPATSLSCRLYRSPHHFPRIEGKPPPPPTQAAAPPLEDDKDESEEVDLEKDECEEEAQARAHPRPASATRRRPWRVARSRSSTAG